MENPFREVLTEKCETFPAKFNYLGQPLKNNCMIVPIPDTEYTDLQYDFIFHQFHELYPHLCEEFEITDEMLQKFWDKQFSGEDEA